MTTEPRLKRLERLERENRWMRKGPGGGCGDTGRSDAGVKI
jgi:hypothetical protein